VRKLYFAFPCGKFGAVITGLGNSGAGGVTGKQTGSGGWADFVRCFGVDDKFYLFLCCGVEKVRPVAGIVAFGATYFFLGSLWDDRVRFG